MVLHDIALRHLFDRTVNQLKVFLEMEVLLPKGQLPWLKVGTGCGESFLLYIWVSTWMPMHPKKMMSASSIVSTLKEWHRPRSLCTLWPSLRNHSVTSPKLYLSHSPALVLCERIQRIYQVIKTLCGRIQHTYQVAKKSLEAPGRVAASTTNRDLDYKQWEVKWFSSLKLSSSFFLML